MSILKQHTFTISPLWAGAWAWLSRSFKRLWKSFSLGAEYQLSDGHRTHVKSFWLIIKSFWSTNILCYDSTLLHVFWVLCVHCKWKSDRQMETMPHFLTSFWNHFVSKNASCSQREAAWEVRTEFVSWKRENRFSRVQLVSDMEPLGCALRPRHEGLCEKLGWRELQIHRAEEGLPGQQL